MNALLQETTLAAEGWLYLKIKKIIILNSLIIRDELGQDILINTQLLNRHTTPGNVYMPSSGDHPKFYEEVFSEIMIF